MKCSSEYRCYTAAKQRCTNPRSQKFYAYGQRGIEFRFKSFAEFIKAIGGPRPAGLVLDRIDNDGHYEPGNVRWTTRSESQRNRRPPTPEQIAKSAATRRGHKRTAEQCRRIREATHSALEKLSPAIKAKRRAFISKVGQQRGRFNAESGFLAAIKTPESLTQGGRAAAHLIWHVRRGILSSDCEFCMGDL